MKASEIIEKVDAGKHLRVDFKARKAWLGKKEIEVEPNMCYGVPLEYDNLDDWLDMVEDLYDNYKYSRPTERSERLARTSYFGGALPMGDETSAAPDKREVAQAKLELYILCSLLSGAFNPDELFAKDVFYQGADPDLVMEKIWF